MNISIIGGNSRNKGALLMLSACVEIIRELPVNRLFIFTPFPERDEEFYKKIIKQNNKFEFSIIKWHQTSILYSFFLRILNIKLSKINKALSKSDYVIDISGISFVSKRGLKHLIYNSLSVYLPFSNNSKILKFPQSIGPVNGKLYTLIAKYFLKKCHKIFARGAITQLELKKLGINSTLSTDLGFYFNKKLENISFNSVVGLNPSIIVNEYFDKKSINYFKFLENLITDLSKNASKVIVFPQSYSDIDNDNIFNDTKIIKYLNNKTDLKNVEFILEDLDIENLFKIYDTIDICVTSRFHGMIMSIISNKIPVVIGWNHKYTEILDSLNLPELNININNQTMHNTVKLCKNISENYEEYVKKIYKKKPKLLAKEFTKILK